MVENGKLILIEGERYLITSVNEYNPELITILPLDKIDAPREFDLADAIECGIKYEIIEDPGQKKIALDWYSLDEKLKEEATRKYYLVKNIRDFKAGLKVHKHKDIKEKLKKICSNRGISVQTYYNWEKLLKQSNDDKIVLVRQRRSDRGSFRFKALVKEIIDQIVDTYLNRPNCISDYKAYEILVDEVRRKNKTITNEQDNIKAPDYVTFHRYVEYLRERVKRPSDPMAKGISDAEIKEIEKFYKNIFSKASRPLEFVLADHHQIDINVLDPETKEVLGRPWVTLLFDAFSRSVLGYYLSMDDPSTISVQLALKKAIFPKSDSYLKKNGCKMPWPMYGTPMQISLDNAWEFKSRSFVNLITKDLTRWTTHAINPIWRPPYKATRGSLIERFFGTLEEGIIHSIPGTTFSNIFKRGKYKSEEEACFILKDIERYVLKFIVDYYHYKGQKELGGYSPVDKWNKGIRDAYGGKVSFPFGNQVEKIFGVQEDEGRQATEHGISFLGLSYIHGKLNGYRHKVNGKRPEIRIRYNPSDISKISLFCEGEYLFDAECKQFQTNGGLQPFSLWELNQCKKLAKLRGIQVRDLNCAIMNEMMKDLEETTSLRKREKRKAASKKAEASPKKVDKTAEYAIKQKEVIIKNTRTNDRSKGFDRLAERQKRMQKGA